MGSGFIFSPWHDTSLEVFKALDMYSVVEMGVDGEDKSGWRSERRSMFLFMCELGLGFELWNSAISSWVFSISLASSH